VYRFWHGDWGMFWSMARAAQMPHGTSTLLSAQSLRKRRPASHIRARTGVKIL